MADDQDARAGADESANQDMAFMMGLKPPSEGAPINTTDAELSPGMMPNAGGSAPGGKEYFDPKVYEALNSAADVDLKHGQDISNQMMGVIESGTKDMQSVAVPQLGQQPKPPQFTGEAIQGWMGAFTALAALAGAGARGNATTALNAFAGGVKGLMEGNNQLFKNNMETWQASSRKMLADNQMKIDQYDLIMKNKKMSMDAKLSALKIAAAQNQDNMTFHLAEAGNYTHLAGLMEKNQAMQQQAQNKQELMEGYKKRVAIALQNQDALKEAADDLADEIASGRAPPNNMGNAQMQKFTIASLKKNHPEFDRTKAILQWQAAQKQVTAVNSQQMNKFTQTATTVLEQMDDLRHDAETLQLGGVNLINGINLQRIIQTQPGTPLADVAQDYITKMATVKSEMASVEMGGYAPIADAWKQVDQQLNANMGYHQMKASLAALEQVLNYRLQAIPNFNTLGPAGANPYTGNQGRTFPNQQQQQQPDADQDLSDTMRRLGIQ